MKIVYVQITKHTKKERTYCYCLKYYKYVMCMLLLLLCSQLFPIVWFFHFSSFQLRFFLRKFPSRFRQNKWIAYIILATLTSRIVEIEVALVFFFTLYVKWIMKYSHRSDDVVCVPFEWILPLNTSFGSHTQDKWCKELRNFEATQNKMCFFGRKERHSI